MIDAGIERVIDNTDYNIPICIVNNASLFARMRRKYPKRNIILRDEKYMTTYLTGISIVKRESMLFITCENETHLYKGQ
jgi:hypothetical protein